MIPGLLRVQFFLLPSEPKYTITPTTARLTTPKRCSNFPIASGVAAHGDASARSRSHPAAHLFSLLIARLCLLIPVSSSRRHHRASAASIKKRCRPNTAGGQQLVVEQANALVDSCSCSQGGEWQNGTLIQGQSLLLSVVLIRQIESVPLQIPLPSLLLHGTSLTPLQSLLLDENVTRQIESVPLHTPGPDLLLQSFAVAAVAKTATKVCNESFIMERFGRLLFLVDLKMMEKLNAGMKRHKQRNDLGLRRFSIL